MPKKKLSREDIKVTTMNLHFEAKVPTQSYGNIVIGGHWGVEVQQDQDPLEVAHLTYEMIREQISTELKPIAKKVYETQVLPMLEGLPEKKRDEIVSRFQIVNAIHQISPEIATFIDPATPKTETE